MAIIGSGIGGAVTSWAGTSNANLRGAAATWELALQTDIQDATPLNVVHATNVAGLRGWTVTYTTRQSTAEIGSAGSVVFAAGYVTHDRGWSLAYNVLPVDTTTLDPTGGWRTFAPGLYSWGGSYNALLDDTSVVTATDAPNTTSSAMTLSYDGTDGFDGTVLVQDLGISVTQQDAEVAVYGFVGDGVLDCNNSGSTNFFPNGNLGTPDIGSLVLTAATGQTFTGDAFVTSFAINAQVDGLIEATVTAQGTGVLTIA